MPAHEPGYAASYEGQDLDPNNFSKQTDPYLNPGDGNANFPKEEPAKVSQNQAEEVVLASHQELATNERQQYEQQIA